MQQYYNKGKKVREFNVGDWVWLKHLPKGQRTLSGYPYSKFDLDTMGNKWIEKVACKLDLSIEAIGHPTFHVTRLKLFLKDPPKHVTIPVANDLIPKRICYMRWLKQ